MDICPPKGAGPHQLPPLAATLPSREDYAMLRRRAIHSCEDGEHDRTAFVRVPACACAIGPGEIAL